MRRHMHSALASVLCLTVPLGGGELDFLKADANLGYVKSEDVIAGLGNAANSSDSELEFALGRTITAADGIADDDVDAALGYAEVFGAVQRPNMLSRLTPRMVGKLSAASQRMQAVIKAGTTRQALETLRPDAFMVLEFTHGAAGTLTIKEKPSLPGVDTSYSTAPLSLRQVTVLLAAGAYASAKVNIKVSQIPVLQLLAPANVAPPVGILIERFAPSSYQSGLKAPQLRGCDEVTLLTEFEVTSTATAAVTYQLILEFRSRVTFGPGLRCISSRGPSLIRGATSILR